MIPDALCSAVQAVSTLVQTSGAHGVHTALLTEKLHSRDAAVKRASCKQALTAHTVHWASLAMNATLSAAARQMVELL
jgi:hypothetical protein